MKKANIRDIDYAYLDIGQGSTMVFAHGLFVDHSIFNSQIATLHHYYRCIAVDLPGHGQSAHHPQGWTLDDLTVEMAEFLIHLELEEVVFIGLSQGGMIGLRLASRYPQLVSKLILVGASARAEFPERIPVWQETLKVLMQTSSTQREAMFHQIQQRILDSSWLTAHPVEAEHERQIMLNHAPEGIQLATKAAVLTRQDIRNELQNITVPVLILVGENDRATPPFLAQEMQALIPHSQLVIIPDAGHHLPLESPQHLTDEVMAFSKNKQPFFSRTSVSTC